MKPSQVAKILGCTPAHIRGLIQKKVITPRKVPDNGGFYYEITTSQLKTLLKLPSRSTRGRSRKSA